MQQIGNAPVRFLLFPDEPHGLGKIAHRKRKMEEEIAWFDQHLFGTYVPPEEAFDVTSPLAMAIEKAKVARDGLRYGEIVDGVLIPEVVEFEGMKVGRFEVTQSQFKAFRPSYEIAPGKENYPVSDVTYEDARAYCEWLGGKTGRRFRLPTTEEMARITERAKSNLAQENNLDHWIGYAPTPDEREALAAKIQELEKSRSLVEEVGSFRPAIVRATAYEEAGGDTASPKATVYDLGGNVAEWVTDKDGGKVMGLSAVSPRDKALPYAPPPSTYVGFRVVEE
jgi:hypothetical protein